jgi:hypothetical protein
LCVSFAPFFFLFKSAEAVKTSSQTRDDVSKFITSTAPPSVDKAEEKVKGNYKTSIKTVALCVCDFVHPESVGSVIV